MGMNEPMSQSQATSQQLGHQTLGAHHQPHMLRFQEPACAARILPLSPAFLVANCYIYTLQLYRASQAKTLSSLTLEIAHYMAHRLFIPHSSSVAFNLHSHLLVSRYYPSTCVNVRGGGQFKTLLAFVLQKFFPN